MRRRWVRLAFGVARLGDRDVQLLDGKPRRFAVFMAGADKLVNATDERILIGRWYR